MGMDRRAPDKMQQMYRTNTSSKYTYANKYI